MPNPTPSDVHVSAALTNISVAYMQDASNFIADKLFPIVGVEKQSDKYHILNKNDFMRDEAKPRAPSTRAPRGGFRVSQDSYSCLTYSFAVPVDDETRANADSALSIDKSATGQATQKLLIQRERKFASTYFTTSVWGTDVTPATLWSAASSTPLKDVDTGKETILKNTGYKPNVLAMSYEVFNKLRQNQEIKDQFKYTSADSITEDMLARYFSLDKVLVGGGAYATNREGASAAQSFVFGKHALLTYVPKGPSILEAASGYIFGWKGFAGSVDGMRVRSYREEDIKSDVYECEASYDMKVVGADLGYFFASVIA